MNKILFLIFSALILTACVADPDSVVDDDDEQIDEPEAAPQSDKPQVPTQDGTLVL